MKSSWKVPYVDFICQHASLRDELHGCLDRLLDSGQYILGSEVESFENAFARYIGVDYAIGVGSGTDALYLAMKALDIGPGDEVITAPNSYLASASSIALSGAKPVFVDAGNDLNMNPELLESVITPRTRAIMPVHLTGRPARMDRIMDIANMNDLAIIEDAAQAVGAKYKNRRVGSLGRLGCFSLHPLKNLSALGDGGVVTTNDEKLAKWLIKARNHGHSSRDTCDFWSHNMRIDALQAAFLSAKLKYLENVISVRRKYAAIYERRLQDLVSVPGDAIGDTSVYHTYVIQCQRRNELKQFLADRGIDTKIHYPTPIHLLEAAGSLGYQRGSFPVVEEQSQRILSLPIAEYLTDKQIEIVADEIERFYS